MYSYIRVSTYIYGCACICGTELALYCSFHTVHGESFVNLFRLNPKIHSGKFIDPAWTSRAGPSRVFVTSRPTTGENARQAREEKDGSGVGCVTHEPPLRMAERSPAAKQSIYAFKMAARNATHPIPRLPSPRPTCTPCRHSVPAKAFTPVEFSTSLSRMPPKLFNFGAQLLTANQPILPSVVREGVLPFASLARRNSSPPSLSLSAFLYLPLHPLHFFLLRLPFSAVSAKRSPPLLPSEVTPSRIDKAREIYCRAQKCCATIARTTVQETR